MNRFIVRTIDYFFYAFMILFLFVTTVRCGNLVVTGYRKYILAGILFVGILLFVYLAKPIFDLLKKLLSFLDKLSVLQMIIILFVFVATTKISLVFLLDTQLSGRGDMPSYVSFANQFASNGIITENTFYANMYKYATFFGLFLSPIVKIFGSDIRVLFVFMSVLYTIITVVLFDIIRPYAGKKCSFLGLLLFNIFPTGLFISQVIIHETGMLFFYVISFWLLLKGLEKNKSIVLRMVSILLSSIFISIGSYINQGGKVVIIAYVLFTFVMLTKDRITIRKICSFAVIAACYFICLIVISGICTNFVTTHIEFASEEEKLFSERAIQNRVKLGWNLYCGSNIESSGEFVREDFDRYHEYYNFEDAEEAKEYQINVIKERLSEFKENPVSIPVHLYYKFKKLYSRPFPALEYAIDTRLDNIFGAEATGYPLKIFRAVSNIYNIFVAIIILFSYQKHKNVTYKKNINPGLQFKMFIIGLTMALILFEMTNKYVSHTQILLTCIGILNVSSFTKNSESIRRRIKNRIK